MNHYQKISPEKQKDEWRKATLAATSFIKSPWGVMLLALLIAVAFAPFHETIMSKPSPKTVILTAALGLTILVWIVAYVMIKGVNKSPTQAIAPFKVTSSKATLMLGSGPNSMTIRLAKDRTTPLAFIETPSKSTLTATLKNGTISLDLNLRASDGKSTIRFRDNELVEPPPRWDWNSNDDAFEVVDESGLPVMQLVRKNDSTLMLMGEFLFPEGGIIADSNGGELSLGKRPSRRANLTPLFKYPSWKHRGTYAE